MLSLLKVWKHLPASLSANITTSYSTLNLKRGRWTNISLWRQSVADKRQCTVDLLFKWLFEVVSEACTAEADELPETAPAQTLQYEWRWPSVCDIIWEALLPEASPTALLPRKSHVCSLIFDRNIWLSVQCMHCIQACLGRMPDLNEVVGQFWWINI